MGSKKIEYSIERVGNPVRIQAGELLNESSALTTDQYRLLYWAIAQIPNSFDFVAENELPWAEITLEEYRALSGSTEGSESLFQILEQNVKRLQAVKVAWRNEQTKENFLAVLVPSITTDYKNKSIEYKLNSSLNEHLFQLKQKISKFQKQVDTAEGF